MQPREIQYARSGDLSIAYEVTGDGPADVVLTQGYVHNLAFAWEHPRIADCLTRLASRARCRAQIEDSDSDVLLVYSNNERYFEKTDVLGDLDEAYCETCTCEIGRAHEGHDDQVEALGREVESLPTHQRQASHP
jgi:hypothetical protein